jgi:hypothetical protein
MTEKTILKEIKKGLSNAIAMSETESILSVHSLQCPRLLSEKFA